MNKKYVVHDITTGLSWGGRPVGITRYEQELAKALRRWSQDTYLIRFVAYDSKVGQYRWVSTSEIEGWLGREFSVTHSSPQQFQTFRKQVGKLIRQTMKYGRKAYVRAFHLLSPAAGEYADRLSSLISEFIKQFANFVTSFRAYSKRKRQIDVPAKEIRNTGELVNFADIAWYISSGLDWDDKNTSLLYREKKRHGFGCLLTIYDLVPVKFPYYLPRNPGRYVRYFSEALWTADRILTISQASRSDIIDFAQRNLLPIPPIDIVSPGSDLEIFAPELKSRGEGRARLENLVQAAKPFAFTVGTLEIRKNHILLLNVWLDLIVELGLERTPFLIIVGGRGWGIDDFLRTLDSNEELKARVFVLEGLSDSDLAYLYQHASLFVYPSIYEGWGIPLTEAAAYGCPIVSSNTSSLPEAAPHHLSLLLDPFDYVAWLQTIRAWAETGKTDWIDSPAPTATIRTWHKAGDEFLEKLSSALAGGEQKSQ